MTALNGLNGATQFGPFSSGMPSGALPVLSEAVPEMAVSPALRDALDALDQDQSDWMSLEAHLLQVLRPEVERLTSEMVRASLREAWRKRSGKML